MSELIDRIMMDSATSLLRQKEQIIMDCVGEISLSQIKKRCRIKICGGVETVIFDGKPILEFHPVEFGEPVLDEGTQSFKRSITQKYRRLQESDQTTTGGP